MSRIGRAPIHIPSGVTVTVGAENLVKVKGPKGELSRVIHPDMKITVEDGVVTVARPSDDKTHRSLHGLFPCADPQHGGRRLGRLHQDP